MTRTIAFVLFALATRAVLASVLAIDYGSDWLKASLMKPGVPFDVLLNKDSKRKIQSSVGWKNDDRLFGSDAIAVAARFPKDIFSSLKDLQGVPFTSNNVEFFKTISLTESLQTQRGTVALKRASASEEWTVELLIAMQFAYVRELAEGVAGGDTVQDAVFTVPAYFSQAERQAVLDAAELAGLRTIALINDGTAVGVNYAMTRTFAPEPEYHIVYDAGASGIRATVLAFATDGKGKKAATTASALGVGYDRLASGLELDRRLRDLLIADFEKSHPSIALRQNPRAMTKLWKEAGRVKAILSANSASNVAVESLVEDVDYRSKLSRATFEEACADLRHRFTSPILDALESSGISLENITSVILAGGATRTPMIQSAVREAVTDARIAVNVNADEAFVLGAAFYGASISRQFKTKDIKVADVVPYDIEISYPAESKEGSTTPRIIHTLVFPAGSKVGAKKTLTFKRKDDFAVRVAYKAGNKAPSDQSDIYDLALEGIAEAIGNLTERGTTTEPVVKATVSLTDSGFVRIEDVHAYGEVKPNYAFTDKIKDFFGAGSSTESDSSLVNETSTAPSEPLNTAENATESPASASAPSASPTLSAKDKKRSEKEAKELSSIRLKTTITYLGIAPLTAEEKRTSRQRLVKVDNHEAAKRRKEEARNRLEAYVYRLRDLLDSGEQDPFFQCSTTAERQAMSDKLADTFTWLHDDADEAETLHFWSRREELESLEKPIQHRYREREAFPKSLSDLHTAFIAGHAFIDSARENLTTEAAADLPSKYTKEEIDAVEKALNEDETWLLEWQEKQRAVKPHEDPVLLTAEMDARGKTLQAKVMRLLKRKIPKPRKTSTSSSSTSTTSASSETEATSSPTADASSTSSTPLPSPSTSHRVDEL